MGDYGLIPLDMTLFHPCIQWTNRCIIINRYLCYNISGINRHEWRDKMELTETLGRLFLIGLPGRKLDDETKEILSKVNPGFIILFQRNIESKDQLKEYITDIKTFLGREVVFAIDQEGGIVTRLENGFTISPGSMAIAATGNPRNAFEAGRILGEEMYDLGISWNLAPVVDINENPYNPSLGVRGFSDKGSVVCRYSENVMKGLQRSGIAATAKHFPGKGSVNVDPHLDMPYVDKTLEELEQNEFVPFKNLIGKGLDAVMISHYYLPRIMNEKIPATVSKQIITNILKERLNFKGITVSDDLTMGGMRHSFTPGEASVKALEAGLDVIDICHDKRNMYDAIEHLTSKAKQDEGFARIVDRAYKKVSSFIRKQFIPNEAAGQNDNIASSEHLETMKRITDQSITLVGNADKIIPLEKGGGIDLIASVNPLRQSLVEEGQRGGYLYAALLDYLTASEHFCFDAKLSKEQADEQINGKSGNRAIVITENAYLFEGQKRLVAEIVKRYQFVLLIALRNPYDGGLPGVKNALLTYGYSQESQRSALDVIKGVKAAGGKCPVNLSL